MIYSKDKNIKTGNTLKTIQLLEILLFIYLVDPASSHILVLKIKPCMSQFFDWYPIDCEWFSITVMI
jgi:hypothetical protein